MSDRSPTIEEELRASRLFAQKQKQETKAVETSDRIDPKSGLTERQKAGQLTPYQRFAQFIFRD